MRRSRIITNIFLIIPLIHAIKSADPVPIVLWHGMGKKILIIIITIIQHNTFQYTV